MSSPTPSNEETIIIHQDEVWQDITPITQNETERPMVQIAYQPEYRKAMDLFRAIVAKEELSERALKLTTAILYFNGSHYTVWNYRVRILRHLHQVDPDGHHLQKELELLNEIMPDLRKSFQAWQHRGLVVEILQDPSKEIGFLNGVLKIDAKNYNTWTYRQTMLCRYNRPELWAEELPYTETLIKEDIRNNSVWNHRFFLVFDTIGFQSPNMTPEEFKEIADREIEFSKQHILKAPNNHSAWNYLRGALKRASIGMDTLHDFVVPLTKSSQQLDSENAWPDGLNKQSNLPVPSAVEFLADIFAQSHSKAPEACELYGLLAEKLDPIRKGYWDYLARKTTRSEVQA